MSAQSIRAKDDAAHTAIHYQTGYWKGQIGCREAGPIAVISSRTALAGYREGSLLSETACVIDDWSKLAVLT